MNLNRVLVPTDFSDFSLEALRYGAELAQRIGAELHVLHVASYAFNEYMAEAGAAYRKSYHEFESALLSAAEEQMEKKLREAGCSEAKSHIVLGCPASEILSCAMEKQVDLIVMGTHGRTGLAHLLIGSVAEKVVRSSKCSVLTVR